jgi:hypothetical protein
LTLRCFPSSSLWTVLRFLELGGNVLEGPIGRPPEGGPGGPDAMIELTGMPESLVDEKDGPENELVVRLVLF